MHRFLERGAMNRTTGGTLMNDASSRSHAIFTVSVEIFECKVLACLFAHMSGLLLLLLLLLPLLSLTVLNQSYIKRTETNPLILLITISTTLTILTTNTYLCVLGCNVQVVEKEETDGALVSASPDDSDPSSSSSNRQQQQKKRTEVNSYVHSKIHLVDLAGEVIP